MIVHDQVSDAAGRRWSVDDEFPPIVDPGLPLWDQVLLVSHPEDMTAACRQPPVKPRWNGRGPDAAIDAVVAGITCGLVPVVALPFVYGWAGGVVGAVLQAGLVAVMFRGAGSFLLAVAVLQVLISLLMYAQYGERPSRRLARERHGRYYLEEDFDARARERVLRARVAVAVVLASEVGKAGLLDGVANLVVLPRQEWEIARACAKLTRIRRRLRRLGSGNERRRKALQPEVRAVGKSAKAVERRVAALERYADRTKAADAAYRECAAFEEIQEISTDLRELLARTVQDDLAVAEIDELSSRTPLAELRRRVEDAREAALGLALEEREPA